MKLPIHNSFGPMATSWQVWQAWKLQLQPWRWQIGKETKELQHSLEQKFQKKCVLFNSGREALLASLISENISNGDEVILQSYTCAVVANAIMATGATPIYCDIDATTLNIDPNKLAAKITDRTRAVIVQHTFGIPADVQVIYDLCKKNGLLLIEDCAHSIPTSEEIKKIGMYGDFIILSFGRDKAVSGVTGGAVLSNSNTIDEILSMQESASNHSLWHIGKLVNYPIRYQTVKNLWQIGLGKLYLKFLAVFSLLPSIYTPQERLGKMEKKLYRMPNACAILALHQWYTLGAINAHRRKLAKLYEANLQTKAVQIVASSDTCTALQKFPVLVHNRDSVLRDLQKNNIYLQDGWCGSAINPPSVDQTKFQYVNNSCPVSEKIASKILTLPLHPTMNQDQAKYLCEKLKESLANQGYT